MRSFSQILVSVKNCNIVMIRRGSVTWKLAETRRNVSSLFQHGGRKKRRWSFVLDWHFALCAYTPGIQKTRNAVVVRDYLT